MSIWLLYPYSHYKTAFNMIPGTCLTKTITVEFFSLLQWIKNLKKTKYSKTSLFKLLILVMYVLKYSLQSTLHIWLISDYEAILIARETKCILFDSNSVHILPLVSLPSRGSPLTYIGLTTQYFNIIIILSRFKNRRI